MMSAAPWGIHWFRRDLRIAGNEALRDNWERTSGRTVGLFCFDSKFLSRDDFSHNRFQFFIETMRELRNELQAQGGELLVVDCLPQKAFETLFEFLKVRGLALPSIVTWNRDYEPFARERDAKVAQLLDTTHVAHLDYRDHLLIEPQELGKTADVNDFYQVYSPFSRKWFQRLAEPQFQKRVTSQPSVNRYFDRVREGSLESIFKTTWSEWRSERDFPFHDAFEDFASQNQKHVTVPIPAAGFATAYQAVRDFSAEIQAYGDRRDIPSVKGTSRLSIYFKNGSLTAAQVVAALGLSNVDLKSGDGRSKYLKEIAWREFYYSILFHRPNVETQTFLPQYREMVWLNRQDWFERWQQGTTGFPIVDAGMRELLTTGWMHNRVRMIVASFLTKDLLIDWRWGERHFMKQLLDGDLAPNNGGWQWAASTGCDPQPYFRIFNPWLQSEKFDPDGLYIKKYVPELAHAPAKALHSADYDRSVWKYPKPIVEHSIQRDLALQLYTQTLDRAKLKGS